MPVSALSHARNASVAQSRAVLRMGSRGASVRELQSLLKAKGFNPGPVDGIFGKKTRAAVIRFQRANHLAVDGIAGPQTWGALLKAAAPKPPVSRPTVRSGSRGPVVAHLQSLLKKHGFNPGPTDGIFGARTGSAVRAFQRAAGLAADGIVGPKTWSALEGGKVTPPPPAGGKGTVQLFLQRALAQKGDKYVYGAETSLNDPNPSRFDCSELVQWAAHQAGVYIPDGSQYQRKFCRDRGMRISVAQALKTPGALLFTNGHVAISLGNGKTIEARGSRWGVGVFSGYGRGWLEAALIPGMKY